MNTVAKALRLRIEELLKEKGMSRYRLAMNCGITHSTLKNIMNETVADSHGRNAGNSIHIGKFRLCKSAEKNCSEAGSYYSCPAYGNAAPSGAAFLFRDMLPFSTSLAEKRPTLRALRRLLPRRHRKAPASVS